MTDKDILKSYLKDNVDNFKTIDFVISKTAKTDNIIHIEAIVFNFSQHYKAYAIIDLDKYKEYKDKLTTEIWNKHKN